MIRSHRAITLLPIAMVLIYGSVAQGQTVRFSNRHEVGIPEYATIRLGPFFSSVRFSQSVGVWWTESTGAGTDFLFGTRRGRVREDGWDIPLVSKLTTRNYVILGRRTDLDLSISAEYYHYPLGTQEDEFYLNIAEPGITAQFAFSSEFYLTKNIRGTIYWNPSIRADFVDARGLIDESGGRRFFHMFSIGGISLSWLAGRDLTLGAGFSREDLVSFEDEFDEQEYTAYDGSLYGERGFFDLFLVGVRGDVRDVDYEDPARNDIQFYTIEVYYQGAHREALGIPLGDNSSISASIGYSVAERETLDREGDADVEREREESLIWNVTLDYGKAARQDNDVMHEFSYQRTHSGSFDADVVVQDTAEYTLTWYTGPLDIGFVSRFINSEPSDTDVNGYWDWANSASVRYHVTRFWDIDFATTYAMRDNESLSTDDPDAAPDLTDDYGTWTTLLRTGYNFTERTAVNAFASHVERRSDSDDFTFERNTAGITFTYTRSF